NQTCPSYFNWIEHDLAPWKGGITRKALEAGKEKAYFRVIILGGKLYTQTYKQCFQTRAEYTLKGLAMLLNEFPGMVPDVDIMFNCQDHPLVPRWRYLFTSPPPVFGYCTTRNRHYDIVFPDWSIWGWPEVNIPPWSIESERIFTEAEKIDWFRRKPIAYWRGNTQMGLIRSNLVKCNSTNILIQHQDWITEEKANFTNSDLSNQCFSRYKIYAEGNAWSVSLKYILSCGSTMLRIEPYYWDFFSRSLLPHVHFLPITRENICDSIQEAIQWSNSNIYEAAMVGKCAQNFLKEQLSTDYVYQYMLHILQRYAKLQKFKP
ncbi:glycosyltransferase, CAZy family GT90, partial [Selaginella moellendorffii]